MKIHIINTKDKGLVDKTLNKILNFVGETPQFYSLAWDFSRKKSPKELKTEGSDYFPQILVEKETLYILQVEETWGGGVNIIFEPSSVRPERMVRDSVVNHMFVRPTFTWAEYLNYVSTREISADMAVIACEAMGIDY